MSEKDNKKKKELKSQKKTEKTHPSFSPAPEEESVKKREQKIRRTKKARPTDQGDHGYNGRLLQQKRMDRGLSLEAVHESTKIPLDVLNAIEEGYNIRTLAPFYLKAFVKKYAAYLEVDVKEIVTDYHKESLPKYIRQDVNAVVAHPKLMNILSHRQKQLLILFLAGVVALFLFFKFIGWVANLSIFKPRPNTKQTQQKKKEKVKKTEKKENISDKKDPVKASVQKAQPNKSSQTTARANAVSTAKPTPVSVISNIKRNIVLTVRAKKSSWLRVETDGNVVFQSTLRRGSVETWLADDKIIISGKNINQLEFELNGKMIGALGREDSRAKKVIITKDGLSVTK